MTRLCLSQMVYPHFVKLSEQYPNAYFVKIYGDHDAGTRDLMKGWGIRSVPTFRFIKNGEVVKSMVGGNPDKLVAETKSFLEAP